MPSTAGPEAGPWSRSRRPGTGCGCGCLGREAEQRGQAHPRHGQALGGRVDLQRCRRPTPPRWRAAPWRCDTAPAFRSSASTRSAALSSLAATSPRNCWTMAGSEPPRADEGLARIQRRRGRAPPRTRRQQGSALRRRLQRLGDHHRDRLARVAHPVVLEQVEPEGERRVLLVRIQRQRRAVGRASSPRTTPGCALAAATSRPVTRPRASVLTAITANNMPSGWLSAA